MIEIVNKKKHPVQLMVRSVRQLKSFNTRVLPGTGAGRNCFTISEERITDQIRQLERAGLVALKETKD